MGTSNKYAGDWEEEEVTSIQSREGVYTKSHITIYTTDGASFSPVSFVAAPLFFFPSSLLLYYFADIFLNLNSQEAN